MEDFEWDFSKLPKAEHKRVIDLVMRSDVKELMIVHNKYRLSIHSYCCANEVQSLLNWFNYALDTGQIKG